MESFEKQSELGSLSQSVRSKQLNSAKAILIVIGVISLLINGALFIFAREAVNSQLNKEVAELRRQNMIVDEEKLSEIRESSVRTSQLLAAIGSGIGITFVVLGTIVKKYPVPITITGLVLYIGCNVIFALINPENLRAGWWIKILIIVGLAKAVQAAIAYEREERESQETEYAPFAGSMD